MRVTTELIVRKRFYLKTYLIFFFAGLLPPEHSTRRDCVMLPYWVHIHLADHECRHNGHFTKTKSRNKGGFSPFIINKQRNKFGKKSTFLAVYNKQTKNYAPSCCLSWFLAIYNKQTKK